MPEASIDRWLERLRERHDELDSARVYANNHFAGFGPGTANAILRRAGRSPREWRDQPDGQATLGDVGDG